jgi:transposase
MSRPRASSTHRHPAHLRRAAKASNGGTEANNGLIELHRRGARGFRNRDNYRLRMLLIGGGLIHPNLTAPLQV